MIGIAAASASGSIESLVRLAADGDHAAFADIVRRHHLDVVRVAFVISGSPDLADQAAASTWSTAWRQLPKLRDADRLRPWLCAIAANEARQLTRRQRRRSVVEIAVDSADAQAWPDPAARVADLDLAGALARLSPDDRALIALRYVVGLNSTEISRTTGMSASGTRARLARLLDRLRKELTDE